MLGQTTVLVTAMQPDPVPDSVSGSCPAHRLPPKQRQGVGPPDPRRITTRRPVGSPASGQPQVPLPTGRHRPARPGVRLRPTAADRGRPVPTARHQGVAPPIDPRLGLDLSQLLPRGHRPVGRPLRHPVSLGTVHNTVQAAVAAARAINASYDLASVRVGAHDEIFQAGRPGPGGRRHRLHVLLPLEPGRAPRRRHLGGAAPGTGRVRLRPRGHRRRLRHRPPRRPGTGVAPGPLSRRCLPSGP